MDVLARLGEDLVDVAGRMADLQSAVPERVEHVVGDGFDEGLDGRRLRLAGEQEHHVHVAQRTEFAAAVAAEGDEGERRRWLAECLGVEREGKVEECGQQGVHRRRPGPGDFQAGGPGFVPGPDGGAFGRQVGLAHHQPLGGGRVGGEGQGRGDERWRRGGHEERPVKGKARGGRGDLNPVL